ncbi:MAG: hypothetical protein ACYTEV_00780 [Planctomycetota bacterium]|jgi:hypothetical protein
MFIAGAVLLAACALVAGMRWWAGPPSWYRPPSLEDSEAGRLAERVEYGLLEQVQRVRPPGTRWTVRLTDEQANAWLATRLPGWWRSRGGAAWPTEVLPPQITTRPDSLRWAAAVATRGVRLGLVGRLEPRAGWASGEPEADASGLARIGMRLAGLGVGRSAGADLDPEAAARLASLGRRTGVFEGGGATAVEAAAADPDAWVGDLIEGFIVRTGRSDAGGAEPAAGDDRGIPVPLLDGRWCRLVAVGLEDGAITMSFEADGP